VDRMAIFARALTAAEAATWQLSEPPSLQVVHVI
jgi:hypothetical protein